MADMITAESIAASIASAGTKEFAPVEVQASTTDGAAPTEGKPAASQETPAPAVEQPATDVEHQREEKPAPVSPAEQDTTLAPKRGPDGKFVPSIAQTKQADAPIVSAPAGEDKAKTEEPDEDTLMREALGIPKSEPETIETLKTRYESSSKEAHRLVMEAKARDAALAEAGVEFTRTADGKFALKANQKYLDSLKDDQLPNVYDKLTPDEKTLVAEDVSKKIVKMALEEALPKRPIAKATGEDATLTPDEMDKCFTDLDGQKLSNGQPKHADIMEPTVVKYMREVYDRPNMDWLRRAMNQSPENFKEGLSLIHASVFRVRAPLLAAKRDAEAAKKQALEQLKKKPTTTTAGTGITPDAMRHKGTPSGKDSAAAIALQIASAKSS